MFLSIISPVYKGEGMVRTLVGRIIQATEPLSADFEVILINDASPDNSWDEILQECNRDKRVKGLNLSRNFGQHYAITAGLSAARGEWIVVMDCDLQDCPEEIPNFIKKTQEGYDVVLGQRTNRQDSIFKRATSAIYMRFFNYLSDLQQDPTVANFGIYHRKVIEAVLLMGDSIRAFPTMVNWVGFKKSYIPVKHGKRELGSSSYSFSKLVALALDSAVSFSDKPLRLMMKAGLILSFASALVALFYLGEYISGEIAIAGFTTLILSLWFLAGIIIALIGVIGLYVGKIFAQVKQRPLFIVKDKVNFNA